MALPTKKLKKCDKHVKHSKNKTCFAMWMTRWKTFSTYSHKRGSHSNVEPYACEEEEEESKKSNNEKSLKVDYEGEMGTGMIKSPF